MGAIRHISPLTGGLPHQCAHWFAMTGNLQCSLSNTNLSFPLAAKIVVGKPEHLCYNTSEVKFMNEHTESPAPEEEGYSPRPAWQIWAARVGVVVMILFVIWQILQIAGGGF